MLEEAFKRVPREQIFAQTGIQFMQINTLYQLLAMSLDKSPLFEVAKTFVTIPDLFNYWLSGEITSEFTNATTTQCFDPRRRDWATPAGCAGHPQPFFPPGSSAWYRYRHAAAGRRRAKPGGAQIPSSARLPRYGLGGGGCPGSAERFRLDQFRHVVDHGRGSARAMRDRKGA